MASINATPAEIQQKILRHVIYLPYFLDPDGIASTDALAMSDYHLLSSRSPWNNMKLYYATERDRNSCRRVCISWNVYLQEKIGHRFVQMIDIQHRNLPASALRNAIRVSFITHHSWACIVCDSDWENSVGTIARTKNERFVHFLRDTLAAVGETRTRIITGAECKHLALIAKHMPNIVTITRLSGGQGMGHSISSLPQLRHLYVESSADSSENNVLIAPNLRTLSFTTRLFMRTTFGQADWNLWDLRSLRTVCVSPGPTALAKLHTRNVIKPLLRLVGSNLRNLFLPCSYLSILGSEIWGICPNLETITAAKDGSVIQGLPSTHSLHTIIVPCFGMERPLVDISTPDTPPTSSLIRTVAVDTPWAYSFPESLIRKWAAHWAGRSTRAEDVYGMPVEDWIAILDRHKND